MHLFVYTFHLPHESALQVSYYSGVFYERFLYNLRIDALSKVFQFYLHLIFKFQALKRNSPINFICRTNLLLMNQNMNLPYCV